MVSLSFSLMRILPSHPFLNSTPYLLSSKSTACRRRLIRDFKRLSSDPPFGVSGAPCADNLMLWNAVIFGPGELSSLKAIPAEVVRPGEGDAARNEWARQAMRWLRSFPQTHERVIFYHAIGLCLRCSALPMLYPNIPDRQYRFDLREEVDHCHLEGRVEGRRQRRRRARFSSTALPLPSFDRYSPFADPLTFNH